jgi:NhaP-type Na+/H+ or K+/H+ antiporter
VLRGRRIGAPAMRHALNSSSTGIPPWPDVAARWRFREQAGSQVELQHPTFIVVLALAVGVLAQSVARHLRVPGIVLLLTAGIGLGPDGLGWIQPRALGGGLYAIVDVAVAVILFEGGLNLELSRLRRESSSIRRLVTWGALITLGLGTLATHWLMEWSWPSAVLFASLITVTGPTVVGPLVSGLRLRPPLSRTFT